MDSFYAAAVNQNYAEQLERWETICESEFDLFFFIKEYLRVAASSLRAPFLQLCPGLGDAILTCKDLTETFQTSVKFLVFPTHFISFHPPFSLKDVVEKRARRQLWQSWESQRFPGAGKEQGKQSLLGRVRAVSIFLEA